MVSYGSTLHQLRGRLTPRLVPVRANTETEVVLMACTQWHLAELGEMTSPTAPFDFNTVSKRIRRVTEFGGDYGGRERAIKTHSIRIISSARSGITFRSKHNARCFNDKFSVASWARDR